jgi:hypothetical protein
MLLRGTASTSIAERYDFMGKWVHPVTTYAMSGLGTTPEDYAAVCRRARRQGPRRAGEKTRWLGTTNEDYAALCRGERIGKGLAVQGEKARSSERAVEAWLRRVGLLTR